MTPQHAKSLLGALKENIAKYEGQFGEIKIYAEAARESTPMGFHADTASNPPGRKNKG